MKSKDNMPAQKVIDLARKLLALAQRGEGGERENAQNMLDLFLMKNGLTMSDIEPSTRTRRIVRDVTSDIRQMFINYCASIIGEDYCINKCQGRNYWAVEMTDVEWTKFSDEWPVYRKSLKREILNRKKKQKKELELLVSAFISKHRMYSNDSGSSKEEKPLTDEEIEEILQMIKMRDGMDDISFQKKLNK